MTLPTINPELALKAMPPRALKTSVPRSALSLSSARFEDCGVIAVTAPAGYGKTTLLTQWRHEALRRGAIVAWLTLDDRDRDGRLINALRMAIVLGCGSATYGAGLRPSAPSGLGGIESATNLLAEISSLAREVVMMLDDVHTLQDGPTLDLLAYVVLNAPANLIIVLASRTDPTPELLKGAMRGRRAVVDANDLRLTAHETHSALRMQVGPDFDSSMCEQLHQLSEGWSLGLQLMISTMQTAPSLRTAIDEVAHGGGGVERFFRQYLVDRLPVEHLDFLLRISVPDIINPDLCIALTGRTDAHKLLKHLCATTPLFDQVMTDDWLRMHALGLEFLRARAEHTFGAEELKALHLKALTWFSANEMPEPAVRHALAAGQATLVYDLTENCLPKIIAQGDNRRIYEWLNRIPPAEMQRRPSIALATAWALMLGTGPAEDIYQLVQCVLDSERATADAKAQAIAAAMLTAWTRDQPDRAAEMYAKWSAVKGTVPVSLDETLRHYRGYVALYSGQPARTRYECQRIADDRHRNEVFVPTRVVLLWLHAFSYVWEGRPDLAHALLSPELEDLDSRLGRRSAAATHIAAAFAAVLWERDEPLEATAVLADRLDVLERLTGFRSMSLGYITAARLSMEEGNEAVAFQRLDHMIVMGQKRDLPALCWEAIAEQIDMHARAGRGKICARLLVQLEAAGVREAQRTCSLLGPLLELRLHIARAQTCIALQDLRAALAHLDRGGELARQLHRGREDIITQLLLVQVRRGLGEDTKAMLDEAVSLANTHGLRRVLRDHLARTATPGKRRHATVDAADATFSEGQSASPARESMIVVPSGLLTPKEREVLQFLAQSWSNKAIANALGGSPETVKWHVKNLFTKLDASSRRHLIDRARQIGILQ